MREPQEKLDLGQLLIEFFDLYGTKFNYNKVSYILIQKKKIYSFTTLFLSAPFE